MRIRLVTMALAALSPFVGAWSAQASPISGKRDIVYSARYYTPPGSRIASHFHLYRINPDGSGRTQITFGNADDAQPLWSPGGTRIAFLRCYSGSGDRRRIYSELCVTGAWGGKVDRLRRYADWPMFEYAWARDGSGLIERGDDRVATPHGEHPLKAPECLAPDGRHYYDRNDEGEASPQDNIVDVRTGRFIPVAANLQYPIWRDNRTVVGCVDRDGPMTIWTLGVDGKAHSHAVFRALHPTKEESNTPWGGGIKRLQAIPGDRRHVVCWSDESCSTIRPWWGFYRVDLATGMAEPLCDGQFLTWSPDGRQFATADRTLVPYGKRRDGSVSRVWGAHLRVVEAVSSRSRDITIGTVLVDGADWRKTALLNRGRSATSPYGSRIP